MRKDIKRSDLVFGILKSDIQLLSEEAIGRRLSEEELTNFSIGILTYFKNWDNWLKENIENEFDNHED